MKRAAFAIVPADLFRLRQADGSPLPGYSIALFTALATFADEDRAVFPSLGTLTEMLGISRANIKIHLRNLHDAGAITIEARFDENGRQTSNLYRLDLLKSNPRGIATDPLVRIADDPEEGLASDPRTIPEGRKPNEQKEERASALAAQGELIPLGAGSSKGSRLAIETLPDLWRMMAKQNGLQPDDIDLEWRKFQNHFRSASGNRGVKADWQRTWDNWTLRAVEDRARWGKPKSSVYTEKMPF